MALAFKHQREGDYVATVSAGGGRLRDIWHITGLTVGVSRALIVSQLLAHLQTLGWDQIKDGLPIAAIKVRKKPPGVDSSGAIIHAASAMVIYASGGFGGGGGLPIAYSRTDGYEADHEVPVFFRTNGLWDERKVVVKRPVRGLTFNQRVQETEYIEQRNEALSVQGMLRDFGGPGLFLLEDVAFIRKASNEIRAELTFVQKGRVRVFPSGEIGNEVTVPFLDPLQEYRRVESDGATAPQVWPIPATALYESMPSGALDWVNFNA